MNQLSSENFNDLAAALCKAQGEMTSALHDKINPHFKSSYASLNSVWDACRGPLSKNGLSIIQQISTNDEMFILTTTLLHSSGQFMRSILPLVALRSTSQALGSSLTYMRRYSIASLVGITTDEDDDANIAQDHQKKNPLPPKPSIQQNQDSKNIIKLEGYDSFVKKFQDEFGNNIFEYVGLISKKSDISLVQVWNSAIQNEKIFEERFLKWNQDQQPIKK